MKMQGLTEKMGSKETRVPLAPETHIPHLQFRTWKMVLCFSFGKGLELPEWCQWCGRFLDQKPVTHSLLGELHLRIGRFPKSVPIWFAQTHH